MGIKNRISEWAEIHPRSVIFALFILSLFPGYMMANDLYVLVIVSHSNMKSYGIVINKRQESGRSADILFSEYLIEYEYFGEDKTAKKELFDLFYGNMVGHKIEIKIANRNPNFIATQSDIAVIIKWFLFFVFFSTIEIILYLKVKDYRLLKNRKIKRISGKISMKEYLEQKEIW